MRADIERVLRENGISENPDSGDIHSWRCKYPLLLQPKCTCFEDLVADLVKVSETTIELNPEQAKKMLEARSHELNRVRHKEEMWVNRTDLDRSKRIEAIAEAVGMGVPLQQVQRFIWGEKLVPHDLGHEAVE